MGHQLAAPQEYECLAPAHHSSSPPSHGPRTPGSSLRASLPLGLAGLSDAPHTIDQVGLPAGATLLLSTDGLTEIRDSAGNFYPLDERLRERAHLAPDELPLSLYEDARRFSGRGQHDDIAVLAVHRTVPFTVKP
ncbi:PP2C family protein-serine/threonine phosphatase [Streptomyces sp. NPDC050264]|uniref:PP2C family protein-serine/threonine phosphatase n=1 Tax=Streptomyces sp. NPDC050264 TaxID=3155038 RepID=UPI003433C51B